MPLTERNEKIIARYKAGETIYQLEAAFGISFERVRQILRQAGVYKNDRAVKLSDRLDFLGITINEHDKKALRAEAAKRKISMSELTADLIKDMLAREAGAE